MATAALVGVLYFAAAALGFIFTHERGLAAPFWVGNALLLVALLRSPAPSWPPLVICAAAGLAAADLVASRVGLATGAVYVTANMAEVLTAAVLLRRGGRAFELSERGDAVRFILACVAAPVVSTALAALTNLVRPGGFGWHSAQTWYTADVLGLVLFTPALWLSAGTHRAIWSGVFARKALFIGLILGLGVVMGATALSPHKAVSILALPILGYLAAEFGVAGAACGMLAVALFSFGSAVATPYLDAPNPPIRDILNNMQISLAGLSVFVLPMGVIVDDKKRIQDTLISFLAAEVRPAPAPAVARARDDAEITAAFVDRAGRLRLIAGDGAEDPAIDAMDGGSLFEFVEAAQHRPLDAALAAAFTGGAEAAPRRLRCRVQVDGDWHAIALTLLSVRDGAGDKDAEALMLLQTAPINEADPRVARAA